MNFKKLRQEQGFTLIELLVVILIIGILAAVAIPVFLNQRTKANVGAVQSDLKNAANVMETELTANKGIYPKVLPGSVKTSTGVKLELVGDANDDSNPGGWTKVGTSSMYSVSAPKGSVNMKLDGKLMIESIAPNIGYNHLYFDYELQCNINTVKGTLLIETKPQPTPIVRSVGSACPQYEKALSVKIFPHESSWGNIDKEYTIYPVGSPENNTAKNSKSYCINGSHDNALGQPWHYDSVAGGLAEGKCVA